MTNFIEEFNKNVLLNPQPFTLIFLCGEKRKLLGIILFFLLPHLDIEACERERESGSKEIMGKFKGMAMSSSFFFFPLLRTCLSCRTQTASLC